MANTTFNINLILAIGFAVLTLLSHLTISSVVATPFFGTCTAILTLMLPFNK